MITRRVENLVQAEVHDGLTHVLELHGARGPVFAGPLPYMARNNAIGLLMRENSRAKAKRRGHQPKTGTTETGLAPAAGAEEPERGKA